MSPVATDPGATVENLTIKKPLDAGDTAILHRKTGRPPTAISAEGMYFTLSDGRKILDAAGGAAVACIGNGNPEVIKVIQDQIATMAYCPNSKLTNEPAEELAQMILDNSDGAFQFCSFYCGGSESMEAAMKLARQYFWEIGQPQRKNFIAREMSYHGNTLGALALSGHPARKKAFDDILAHDSYHYVSPAFAVRYQQAGETEQQYVERLANELDDKFKELGPDTVIGFVAETVVGATTGCVPPPKGYFKAMRAVCDKYGALLIQDEVMSGMGRMGTLHGWQTYGDGAHPDLQAVAKGLGGGYVSIGALLISGKIADGIRQGSGAFVHGHTYQAQPVAAAGALAVQKYVKANNLIENCRKMGVYLGERLRATLLDPSYPGLPYIFSIRGGGCFWAVEFDLGDKKTPKPIAVLIEERAFEKGVMLFCFPGNLASGKGDYAMMAPAFNVTTEQIDTIVDVLAKSLEELAAEYL